MVNEINNDVPTVYALHDGQTVYVKLEDDHFVQRVTNKLVREKGSDKLAYGTKTFGLANHVNSLINPKAVTDGYQVTSANDRNFNFANEGDQLVINMKQGQNCIIGFLGQNNQDFKAGYIFSSFTPPVNDSDYGLWEYPISAGKTEEFAAHYGRTDLQKVEDYFAQAQQEPITVESSVLEPLG